jgi:NAD(P)-dependent dehydrogenase (short-subunit alcohol dehydrogenase family)
MREMGRLALVTGASSGIGAAIVRRLLDDGWRVVGAARRETSFDAPGYRGVKADLGTAEGCAAAAAAAESASAFVHAAGFMEGGRLGQLAASDPADMWRLHVRAAEALADTLVPRMAAGGRIVLIGSRTAAGAPGRSRYAATKAALVAMARSWAAELAARGVTVNVVAPAATETPMLQDPQRAGVAPVLPPIGRYIRPEEVAAAVAFLLSREADAITGQTLTICGGASL